MDEEEFFKLVKNENGENVEASGLAELGNGAERGEGRGGSRWGRGRILRDC
jgi:hypothetical protein